MIRLLVVSLMALAASRAGAHEIDYKTLYERTAPAVVLVYGQEKDTGAMGTGSIVRPDGLVVTNAHVIINDETKKPYTSLFVFLKPDRVTGKVQEDLKRSFGAQWLAYSVDLDLALLRVVDGPAALPVLEISDDSDVGVGEATAAIGHPAQGSKWSLTTGRIGGEWSDFEGVPGKDVYQMETSVNPGNSGGPLLDGNGHMVGINTSIARRGANGLAITGVNFAIKSRVVRAWIARANETIADAPEVHARSFPVPQAVARARPSPPPAGGPSGAGPPNKAPTTEVVPPPPPGAKRTSLSRAVPPPAAPAARGFTSRARPGQVLSGPDLTRQRASDAFQDLDREIEKAFPEGETK